MMATGAGVTTLARGGWKSRSFTPPRAREAGDALGDTRLRARAQWKPNPTYTKGIGMRWSGSRRRRLPVAWEIGEWDVVLWSSAWVAIAYLKLGRPADAQTGSRSGVQCSALRAAQSRMASHTAQIALAKFHLAAGDNDQALSCGLRGASSCRSRPLASRARRGPPRPRAKSTRPWATGPRPTLRSAAASRCWREIQSRPELAQTLLAYGRFRRGDNTLEDRAMIERALALFEEMNATGWIEEARAALAAH